VGGEEVGEAVGVPTVTVAQGGFDVGPTVEACTRGVWLWSEPQYLVQRDGSPMAVLFMDTE